MKIDIDKITEAELVRGQRWTVAPGLLSKIKPVSASGKGNVAIDFDGKKK
jgi:hypothetical protein